MIIINGRQYNSNPSTPINIPDFDATVAEANGWIRVSILAPADGSIAETIGTKLRRLFGKATGNNRLELPPIRGCRPWKPAVAWAASMAVAAQAILYTTVSGTNYFWLYIRGGNTGTGTGPAGTNPASYMTDGTATCVLIAIGNLYPAGTVVTNNTYGGAGATYICRTAGLPATSGSGPSGGGTGIADGACVWDYYGEQEGPVLTFTNLAPSGLAKFVNATNSLVDKAGPIRVEGGWPAVKNTNYVAAYSVTSLNSGNPLNAGYNQWFKADIESAKFDIKMGYNDIFSLTVDGRKCDWDFQIPSGAGQYFYALVDFTNAKVKSDGNSGSTIATGRARRRIGVYLGSGAYLAGFDMLKTDNISYPDGEDFSVAFIGDSVSLGTGNNQLQYVPGNASPTYGIAADFSAATQICVRAGLPEPTPIGIGGTGYVNNGPAWNYAAHVLADLTTLHAYRPLGAIFFWGSSNDSGYLSQITGAAHDLYTQVRAAYPGVPIFVIGSAFPPVTSMNQIENNLAAAVTQRQNEGDNLIWFIPATNDPSGAWIFGTGSDTAPANDGNADIDWNGALGHPNYNGYLTIGKRGSAAYGNLIQSIP